MLSFGSHLEEAVVRSMQSVVDYYILVEVLGCGSGEIDITQDKVDLIHLEKGPYLAL